MAEMKIGADALALELALENEWRRNRQLVLAQQLADAKAKIAALEADKPEQKMMDQKRA